MDKHLALPLLLALVVGYISWLVFSSLRSLLTARLQAAAQARLIDRIGSAEALTQFVESAPGMAFLQSLNVDANRPHAVLQSVLTSVRFGILLLFAGGTLLGLHWTSVLPASDFLVVGMLAAVVGLGCLVSAAATYVLAGRFKMLPSRAAE